MIKKLYIILIAVVIFVVSISLFMLNMYDGSNIPSRVGDSSVSDEEKIDTEFDDSLEIPNTFNSIRDCGDSLNCFGLASLNCERAIVRHVVELNTLGKQTTTFYYEIKGPTDEKCVFHILTENIEIEYDERVRSILTDRGLSNEEIQKLEDKSNSLADNAEGTEGTCNFVTEDLFSMISRWESGVILANDLEVAECEGPHFSPLF